MNNINIQGYHHRTAVFINDTTRFIQQNEQSIDVLNQALRRVMERCVVNIDNEPLVRELAFDILHDLGHIRRARDEIEFNNRSATDAIQRARIEHINFTNSVRGRVPTLLAPVLPAPPPPPQRRQDIRELSPVRMAQLPPPINDIETESEDSDDERIEVPRANNIEVINIAEDNQAIQEPQNEVEEEDYQLVIENLWEVPQLFNPVGPEVRLETPSPLRERRGRFERRQSRSRSRSPLERRQLFPEIQRQEEEEIVPERNDFDQMNILEDDLEQRNDGNQVLNQIQLVNVQVPAPAAVQMRQQQRRPIPRPLRIDDHLRAHRLRPLNTYQRNWRPENIAMDWREEVGVDLEDFPDVDRIPSPLRRLGFQFLPDVPSRNEGVLRRSRRIAERRQRR
ncbi:hypothetical protein JTE90_000885 [Oedothorax gibbosus]|uniref:Uncharacterized protein n=1 Tax=Oedothorax gibbosus TaxID=931172 RepID=A0AAV6VSY1_9ARAC|nr:hypothetical protein JTE90_000885 [Oedothorax gibbosus]